MSMRTAAWTGETVSVTISLSLSCSVKSTVNSHALVAVIELNCVEASCCSCYNTYIYICFKTTKVSQSQSFSSIQTNLTRPPRAVLLCLYVSVLISSCLTLELLANL